MLLQKIDAATNAGSLLIPRGEAIADIGTHASSKADGQCESGDENLHAIRATSMTLHIMRANQRNSRRFGLIGNLPRQYWIST